MIIIIIICCCYFLAQYQLDYPAFKVSFQQFEKSVQIIQWEWQVWKLLKKLNKSSVHLTGKGCTDHRCKWKIVKDCAFSFNLVRGMLPATASHTALYALVWLAAFLLSLFLPLLLSTCLPSYLSFLPSQSIYSTCLTSKGPLSVSKKQCRRDHKTRLNSLFTHKNSHTGPASRLRLKQQLLLSERNLRWILSGGYWGIY